MKTENLKPKKNNKPDKTGYNPSGDEKKVYNQYKTRKLELLASRSSVYGLDIDSEMRRMDKMYFRKEADIPASELDPDSKPVAINNAYGKVNTALGIIIDKNPKYNLDEDNPKYAANRAIIKALGEKSFRNTNSLGQFKLSVFNAARRGWFIGRTLNRQLIHDARFLKSIDAKGKRAYETKTIVKMDDVAYMNLSNYNAWLDEQTKPEDFFSTRDWMWREVWQIEDLKRTFPVEEFPNIAFVTEGGDTSATLQGQVQNSSTQNQPSPQSQKTGMVEVYFYENQFDDWFIMEANGVMVVWEPLPQNSKRLSCSYGYWHLRGDDTIYGIGILEEMEKDEQLVDRILNMDMRELLLTIAPMGFYSGSEDMEDENIRIKPGTLKRVLDPQSISWTTIPPGNRTAIEKIEWLEKKQADKTGITETIQGSGDVSGKTAFEVGVDREAGLKRLRLPLKSFQYALDWEFMNRISLIQQVYSDFQVEHLATQDEIDSYLTEVGEDKEFYFIENEGQAGQEKFYKKKYRQVSLGLKKSDKGTFDESDIKDFFTIKPSMMVYEGFVTTDISSLLIASEELEKADTLRMVNILVPMLQLPKEIAAKPAYELLHANNKEPKKWLPQEWLDFLDGKKPAQDPNAIPGGNGGIASLIAPSPSNSNPPTSNFQPLVPSQRIGTSPYPISK